MAAGAGPKYAHQRYSLSDLEFDEITERGALANASGAVGVEEFETVMLKQIYTFIQRTAYDCANRARKNDGLCRTSQPQISLRTEISVRAPARAGGEGTLNGKQRLRELKNGLKD